MITATSSESALRSRHPRDLDGWAARFDPAALPVLAATAEEIELLREREDAVDAHLLAERLSDDPLMTLKLLAHVSGLMARRRRPGDDARAGEPETVTAALVMLGIGPFFRTFGPQPTLEDRLADQPEALAGARRVLRRSHRAATFAMGFAVHRLDHDAAVLHEAELLHDFAELLLWIDAPALALEIRRRQRDDPALRSAAVQRELLGIELAELQHRLMERWRLPSLLVQIDDDHARTVTPQMRNVRLAIRVTRHSMDGWHDAALPDDIAEIAQLLQLAPQHTLALLHDIDRAA